MTNASAPIYLDNNATTPLDPRVLEAMLPFFTEHFGNPESTQHAYGWKAKAAIEKAREQVATLIHAQASEIIFTSGATESTNIAILGSLKGAKGRRHIISSQVEHKATLEVCRFAEELGHKLTLLPVNSYGQVESSELRKALRPDTAIISLLHGNNEIGSLNPIEELGKEIATHRLRHGLNPADCLFHVDAAQTIGKVGVDIHAMKIDLLSLSAHKLYGPKGVGALYQRRPTVHLEPIFAGGGQERGLRSGTHNTPAIVGLGAACEIAGDELIADSNRLKKMIDFFYQSVLLKSDRVRLNGHPTERVPSNIHISIKGLLPDQLLADLSDFAFSSASACSAGGPSHVLQAIRANAPAETLEAHARFGLGRFTKESDIEHLIQRLLDLLKKSQ